MWNYWNNYPPQRWTSSVKPRCSGFMPGCLWVNSWTMRSWKWPNLENWSTKTVKVVIFWCTCSFQRTNKKYESLGWSLMLFDSRNETQTSTLKRARAPWHALLSIPWALVSEDLMPACRTPIQWFADQFERSHRCGEWWPAFQHIPHLSLKKMERENEFYRCVLYDFRTFCKRNIDFFVRFHNSECCETKLALELASYPNNPNISKDLPPI